MREKLRGFYAHAAEGVNQIENKDGFDQKFNKFKVEST
jgi:hypothetical protein